MTTDGPWSFGAYCSHVKQMLKGGRSGRFALGAFLFPPEGEQGGRISLHDTDLRIQSQVLQLGTESAFTVLARARQLEATGREVLHLELGEPDFPTPPHIVEAAMRRARHSRRAMDAWQSRRGPAQPEAILVVDDEEVVRRVMRQALEADGYVVLEAEGGVEALEMLMRREPRVDLVLTDGTMRGMDGWELVRIIGAILPGLPTILMTGWAVAPAKELPAAPTAVLEKPFTPAALTESVRNVLAARGRV